jgi:hypothetical protein
MNLVGGVGVIVLNPFFLHVICAVSQGSFEAMDPAHIAPADAGFERHNGPRASHDGALPALWYAGVRFDDPGGTLAADKHLSYHAFGSPISKILTGACLALVSHQTYCCHHARSASTDAQSIPRPLDPRFLGASPRRAQILQTRHIMQSALIVDALAVPP